jgi:hypothetical protein
MLLFSKNYFYTKINDTHKKTLSQERVFFNHQMLFLTD